MSGHAGQVAGITQALANDQRMRVDLVDEVADGGVHGGEIGRVPGPPMNCAFDQRSLNHRPFSSVFEQHQPKSSR
jgi:hypothetical protein